MMCNVIGHYIDIAFKLTKWLKAVFEPKLGITFDSNETVLGLNGCSIETDTSNHLDAYRGLDNPRYVDRD
jgi:hypothetical protein